MQNVISVIRRLVLTVLLTMSRLFILTVFIQFKINNHTFYYAINLRRTRDFDAVERHSSYYYDSARKHAVGNVETNAISIFEKIIMMWSKDHSKVQTGLTTNDNRPEKKNKQLLLNTSKQSKKCLIKSLDYSLCLSRRFSRSFVVWIVLCFISSSLFNSTSA